MLTTGTKGKAEVKVDDTNTAVTMGSGSLKVFATPAMIALIEKAACKALEGQLEDGQTTVGTKLDVAHIAATPIGMNVTAEAVLTEIDNRKLVFEVVARDEKDIIGKGIHERFIVNAENSLLNLWQGVIYELFTAEEIQLQKLL